MRNPPAEVMASWPTPNYDNPERRGDALLITELSIVSVAIITLLARLYVRFFMVKTIGSDDWLMVVAMIFGFGVTICVILADRSYGWSVHIWDLTPTEAVKGRQVSLAAQTFFIFSSGLAKVSILLTYLRIAPRDSWFRRLTWGSIAVVTAQIFVFLIVLWTQCIPMKSYWVTDGLKDCQAEGPRVLAQAITTAVIDLLVCALPLPTLLTLRLPRWERLVLAGLFSLGVVVVVAACMRAYWSHHVTNETYDVTWEGFYLWIWTAVEANLGVICGNIPALRALYKRMFPRKSSYYTTEGSRARGGSNARKSNHAWTDSLHGNKGMKKLDDDSIHAEEGTYELRQYKSHESPAGSLEIEAWPPGGVQRLPDHARGPLSPR